MSNLTIRPAGGSPSIPHDPAKMFLGMLRPGPEEIGQLVDLLQRKTEEDAIGLSPGSQVRLFKDAWPLNQRDYCRYVRDFKQLGKELRSNGRITSVEDNAGLRGLLALPWQEEFTPDFHGFVAYLKALYPVLEHDLEARMSQPSEFIERARVEHTLIVAPVNWGKSELMKTLAYHYAEHAGLAAVVVLDPGGDMARQIARWPELVREDRVILIEPELQDGKTVAFNQLDGRGLNEHDRSIIATFWAQQIGALTKDLSSQMERVARHCVHVLLAYPGGATFYDMILLLGARKEQKNPRQRALLRFAQAYPDALIADFFNDDFMTSYYESTRVALKGRIDALLSYPYVKEMFCGPANFSLEQALEERKFVVVNLAKFGQAGGAAVGKVFVALLGAIARKRNTLPMEKRTPTHVFIDEVSTMVSEQLLKNLKELRKFGLYQTLAQQVEGDGFSKDYKHLLTRLTACKFLGAPRGDEGDLLHSSEELPPLNRGHFWVQWPGNGRLSCLQVRPHLADYGHKVEDDEWQDYENAMVRRYYADAKQAIVVSVEDEFEEEAGVAKTPAEARQQRAAREIPWDRLGKPAERPAQVAKPGPGPRPRKPKR